MNKVIGFITTKKSKEEKGTKDVYVCNEIGARLVASGVKYIGHFEGLPATGYILEGNTVYFNLDTVYIDPVHPIDFNEKELSKAKKELFTSKIEEATFGKKVPVEDFFADVTKTLQDKAKKDVQNGNDEDTDMDALVKLIEKAGGKVIKLVSGAGMDIKGSTVNDKANIAKSLEDSLNAVFGSGTVKVIDGSEYSHEDIKQDAQQDDTFDYTVAANAYIAKDFSNPMLISVMKGEVDFTKFSNELTRITGNKFYTKIGTLMQNLTGDRK